VSKIVTRSAMKPPLPILEVPATHSQIYNFYALIIAYYALAAAGQG
jgi:hypothetical protein